MIVDLKTKNDEDPASLGNYDATRPASLGNYDATRPASLGNYDATRRDEDQDEDETDTSLDFARDCGYITDAEHEEMTNACTEIGNDF